MIQRIQSVFLVLIAACMITMLFMPIWVKGDLDTQEYVVLNAFQLTYENRSGDEVQIVDAKSTIYISVLAIIAAGVALFSIFRYRNRMTQMKLGLLNSLLMAGLVVCAVFVASKADSFLPTYPKEFKIGFFLPVAALLFNSLSNRFIRRDEKLVRDSDRMR